MIHLETDAPEESDLWTALQLFPLDDNQTCHSKDWVGDWVGVELLYNSVKAGSQTVGDQRRRRQDVVGKATPGRRGPRDTRCNFGDQLVIRCIKESHHSAESWALGLRLSSSGERERHNADGHRSLGQHMSQLCSVSNSLSHTNVTIKWEVHIFLKKSSLVIISCVVMILSAWICIWVYNIYTWPIPYNAEC